jgi:hypothetical protein
MLKVRRPMAASLFLLRPPEHARLDLLGVVIHTRVVSWDGTCALQDEVTRADRDGGMSIDGNRQLPFRTRQKLGRR